MTTMATPSSTAISWTVRREPIRATTGPARGSEITEPAAIESSTSPSSAEDSPSRSRTWGISDAQLAKENPVTMNAAYVARVPAAVAAVVDVESVGVTRRTLPHEDGPTGCGLNPPGLRRFVRYLANHRVGCPTPFAAGSYTGARTRAGSRRRG